MSKYSETRKTPSIDTDPLDGLIPKSADLDAGVTVDPSSSVPKARGLYPADRPTAEPEDEPPGALYD